MQSDDGDRLVLVNHHIEIAWSRCINLKRILTSPRLPRSVRLRLLKASVMSTLLNGCESRKLSTLVQRKLNFQESRDGVSPKRPARRRPVFSGIWETVGAAGLGTYCGWTRAEQLCTKSTSDLRQVREGIIIWWHSQPKCTEKYRKCTR